MPEPQPSNPRKHQRPLPLNGLSQPRSKRQKVGHYSESESPITFWDNLSKVWLTKRALRELDRRTAAPSLPHSLYPRPHQPLTRELKKCGEPARLTDDPLCQRGPRVLKDIQLFAKHGGPDLSDLKGYPEPLEPTDKTMSSGQPSSQGRKRGSIPTKNTKSTSDNTKSTGPYDRNFQQKLINGGVFPCGYEYPDGQEPAKPVNLEEIKQRLARPRPSLSPSIFSDEAHKEFVRADIHARKEIQVMTSVIPTITGIIQDLRGVSGGVPFTHLNNLTDDILTPGNPDLYYGARPEDLDKRILKELHCLIVPSTPEDLPITPNFFLAVKGPEGSHAVAQRQASYDGALGARAMHAIHSYGQDTPVYDNRAFTITSIYHHGTLQMYTSHLTQPTYPGDRPRYFTNRLKGWYITSDPESFREGVTWFRNAIDWTMEQRDIAIARANERVKDVYAAALAANVSDFSLVNSLARDASPETDGREPLTQESQTSLNEDSDPESSTDELASSSRPRTKRSGNRSKQPQTQRKRRITDGPSDAGD